MVSSSSCLQSIQARARPRNKADLACNRSRGEGGDKYQLVAVGRRATAGRSSPRNRSSISEPGGHLIELQEVGSQGRRRHDLHVPPRLRLPRPPRPLNLSSKAPTPNGPARGWIPRRGERRAEIDITTPCRFSSRSYGKKRVGGSGKDPASSMLSEGSGGALDLYGNGWPDGGAIWRSRCSENSRPASTAKHRATRQPINLSITILNFDHLLKSSTYTESSLTVNSTNGEGASPTVGPCSLPPPITI
ncbi:hypothetical protein NL676_020517 [Syzygium grande]|nr:hypothetical protein NL676_020517 [Syzygium grande]